ncbi:MAG TPA: hypothetical protein VEL75_16520 [Candidatus Methylomirabilis sp.]|nr:hypothetical protein [Candidatus Methylomirabilis sp.]
MAAASIGIVGDFDGRAGHVATNDSIQHAAASIGAAVEAEWLPTATLVGGRGLERFDGFWGSPGSPYRSMEGALDGIRFARERNRPFLGT